MSRRGCPRLSRDCDDSEWEVANGQTSESITTSKSSWPRSTTSISRAAEGGLSPEEHRRLESIKVGLDQCWDLLRQRRALREASGDPDAAHVRDPEVVEHYEQ